MELNQLQSKLNKNSSMRKKEITLLTSNIIMANQNNESALLRASFILLYAHYEGFSKEALRLFLKYLNTRNCNLDDLTLNFSTMYFTKSIIDVKQSTKKTKFHELVSNIHKTNTIFKVDEMKLVNTESNLKYHILEELLFMLGTDGNSFNVRDEDNKEKSLSLKENFIDKEILEKRNKIAHGEMVPVTLEEYNEARHFIVNFIDALVEKILDICMNEEYLMTPA